MKLMVFAQGKRKEILQLVSAFLGGATSFGIVYYFAAQINRVIQIILFALMVVVVTVAYHKLFMPWLVATFASRGRKNLVLLGVVSILLAGMASFVINYPVPLNNEVKQRLEIVPLTGKGGSSNLTLLEVKIEGRKIPLKSISIGEGWEIQKGVLVHGGEKQAAAVYVFNNRPQSQMTLLFQEGQQMGMASIVVNGEERGKINLLSGASGEQLVDMELYGIAGPLWLLILVKLVYVTALFPMVFILLWFAPDLIVVLLLIGEKPYSFIVSKFRVFFDVLYRYAKPLLVPFKRIMFTLGSYYDSLTARIPQIYFDRLISPFIFWITPPLLFLALYYANVPYQIGMDLRWQLAGWLWLSPVFFLTLFVKNRFGNILTLGLVCLSLALPLYAYWASGVSDGQVIGGFLPFSDSNGYYTSAETLNSGYLLSVWGSRRPLFHGFLAILYFLCGKNLLITLALMTILCAVAIYFSAMEVRNHFGAGAATLYVLVTLMFFRRFVGSTLSENLGIIFGTLSLAVLLRGIFAKNKILVAGGAFLLTLGLNARAGAFFVLPLIILWVWFFYTHRLELIKKAGATFLIFASILLGFLINNLLVETMSFSRKEERPGGGNFAYSLYGMVFGGDWTKYQESPELLELREKELTDELYLRVIEAVKENPSLLSNGMIRAWQVFFNGFVFSFVYEPRLNAILFALTGVSLIFMLMERSDIARFLLACLVGIVLSVPFAPPWDADSMRAYAATIPLVAIFPAFALNRLQKLFQNCFIKNNHPSTNSSFFEEQHTWISPLTIFSALMVLFCFPFPLILQRVKAAQNIELMGSALYENSDGRITFRLLKRNFLNIVSDNAQYVSSPDVRKGDFEENIIGFKSMYPEHVALIEDNLKVGVSLKYDPMVKKWILIDTILLEQVTDVFEGQKKCTKSGFCIVVVQSE